MNCENVNSAARRGVRNGRGTGYDEHVSGYWNYAQRAWCYIFWPLMMRTISEMERSALQTGGTMKLYRFAGRPCLPH